MQSPIESFVWHDLAHFPLVWISARPVEPGYAAQWEREMAELVAHGQPFVMLHHAAFGEESHEDRKQRGLWLKHHKLELQRCCLAMIGIEPDAVKRLAMQAQSAIASKAFGIPTEVVSSAEEAESVARRLLGLVTPSTEARADAR